MNANKMLILGRNKCILNILVNFVQSLFFDFQIISFIKHFPYFYCFLGFLLVFFFSFLVERFSVFHDGCATSDSVGPFIHIHSKSCKFIYMI